MNLRPPAFLAALTATLTLLSCVPNSDTSGIQKPASKTKGAFSRVPRIIEKIIPPGNLNRRTSRKMKPKYITIHSTANRNPTADAEAHVQLLHRAGLGRLSWHYTVDEKSIFQTLPTNEQGQHADYEGPGNQTSIGIEMCENEGNSVDKTVTQTAKLTAFLMKKHDIPMSRVVPHQHWKRVRSDGKDFGHKNCPRILIDDDGRLGRRWHSFQLRIKTYQ